jgi:hypothetical protein
MNKRKLGALGFPAFSGLQPGTGKPRLLAMAGLPVWLAWWVSLTPDRLRFVALAM